METGTAADDGNNFGIVGNSGGEIYYGNKYQNRHEGDNEVNHPKRIKVNQEVAYGEAVFFYFWRFGLHINHHNNCG